MKPEEQRIAIAKACGWTDIDLFQLRKGDDKPWYTWGAAPDNWHGEDCAPWLPDFLNDLNAMHEAEKFLIERLLEMEYRETLGDIVGQYQCIWHATASQRAEAFLKTLNLWQP